MTRINLVPVEDLADQHLFAEYRELPRLSKFALTSIKKQEDIPITYRMGAGHMTFFLDKGLFLENRYLQLIAELKKRAINFTEYEPFKMPNRYGRISWSPSEEEIAISKQRIDERLAQKPKFYKWTPNGGLDG